MARRVDGVHAPSGGVAKGKELNGQGKGRAQAEGQRDAASERARLMVSRSKKKVNLTRRKALAQRKPGGRIVNTSSAERERDVKAVALNARIRHGLRPADADKAEAEMPIGLALLHRYLDVPDSDQRRRIIDAAHEYETLHREYLAVLGARQLGSASDYDRGPSYDGSEGDAPAYVERCQSVRRRFSDARSTLLNADTFAQFAVDTWVIERKPALGMMGELLIGLNALAKLFAGDRRIRG